MKIHHILYMAGLSAVMAACTEDTLTKNADGRVPVTLSYQTTPPIMTRTAAATNLNEDHIESGKQVTVRISNTNPSDYTTGTFENFIYTTGADGELQLPSPAPYYPLDGTNVDILAFYPSFDINTSAFSIQTDQTTNEAYTASDLMWAEPIINTAKSTSNKTLTFSHKMAKISVRATAGTAVSQINSITLKQVQPTVTFNKTTGAVSGLTGTADDVKIVKDETSTSVSGAAVFPEQPIDGRLLAIGVTLTNGNEGTAYYTVSNKTFEAGKVYRLDITVSYPEVEAETEITGWTDGGTAIIQPSTVQQTFDVDNNGIMTFNVNGVQFNMVAVKGGAYTTLGGAAVTGTLSDYYIGQTQVTQALWKAVMGSVPDGQTNEDERCPVANVTWIDICGGSYTVAEPNQTVADADCFLTKLNAALAGQLPDGFEFTLPTEAQWEYAARGGQYKETFTYVGTNDAAELADRAWYSANADNKTHPVALKKPNSLGLYDMNGNVWEWCQDWYNITVTTSRGVDFVEGTPTRNGDGHDCRGVRGGSWGDGGGNWTVSARGYGHPTDVRGGFGLRLVLARKKLTFNVNGVVFHMMPVEGGDYSMYWNTTQITGSLSDYYIGQTEVTQALWKAVMGNVPSGQTNTDIQAPVAKVSWLDICGGTYNKVANKAQTVAESNSFLYKLNTVLADQLVAYGMSDMSFKLPTDVQWEYAAMGGQETHNYTYAGTNEESDLINYAWYGVNSGSKTHPVGEKKPNELGLYDMNGNLCEWCRDWHNSPINGGNSVLGLDFCNTDSPQERDDGNDYRVLRGAGWFQPEFDARVSSPGAGYPSLVDLTVGLRLVLQ